MAPRTILYTGKGGVGKTSVAAATARRCAAGGARTLVLSTDPAHSLADSLQMPVGAEPTPVGDGLWAQQVQAQEELERHWSAVQEWLGGVLAERGVDRIAAEELTVPPGGDELFSCCGSSATPSPASGTRSSSTARRPARRCGCSRSPTRRAGGWTRCSGARARCSSAARPFARAFLDLQLPDERVMADIQRLVGNLIAMHELLRDAARVSLRLVMTPDRMVVAEAMRTFTYLNLYGYLTDAVVVNRVFPDELAATYFGAWREVQAEQLALVESGFAPVPVLRAPYFEQEVLGGAMLDRLAGALFAGARRRRPCCTTGSRRSCRSTTARAELRLDLPFARKGDVALRRSGSSWSCASTGRSARSCCPARWPASSRRGASLARGLARRGASRTAVRLSPSVPSGLRRRRAARARGAGARPRPGGRRRGAAARLGVPRRARGARPARSPTCRASRR